MYVAAASLWSWALPHRRADLSAEGFGGSGWPALIQRVYSIVLSAMVWLSASFIRKPNTSSSTSHTHTLSWDETLLSLSRHSCQTYKHSPHTDTDTPTPTYTQLDKQKSYMYICLGAIQDLLRQKLSSIPATPPRVFSAGASELMHFAGMLRLASSGLLLVPEIRLIIADKIK